MTTYQEQYQKTHLLAQAIAAALGDGWVYAPSPNRAGEALMPWARVNHADGGGFGVCLSPYGRRGRVVIDARFPAPDGRDING